MDNLFLNLLRATRVHRTLTGLGTLMIPVAFADRINLDIIFLCLSLVILYAAVGLQNARKDKDYPLPSYTEKAIILLAILALLVSFKNIIIFATVSLIFLLGLFYNYVSRYVLFMDVTVVTATHHLVPMLSAALILDLDILLTLKLSLFIYAVYWLFVHIKNLKDGKEDRRRGYKTLSTEFSRPKEITLVFFDMSFVLMLLGYYIFGFSPVYLVMVILLSFVKSKIQAYILIDQTEKALHLLRFMSVFFTFIIVMQADASFLIELLAAMPLLNYGAILALDHVKVLIHPLAGKIGHGDQN